MLSISRANKNLIKGRTLLYLVFSFFIVSIFYSGIGSAQSGGSVGGGGGPGGGDSGSYYTSNGHSWAVYQVGGSGPQGAFRDGTSWSYVQGQCNTVGSTQVYGFIIREPGGKAKIYQFKSDYDTYRGKIGSGQSVDDGRATTVSTATAKTEFDKVPADARSGFTFGSNVAWFCKNAPTNNWDYQHSAFGIERDSGSGWGNAGSGTPQYGNGTSIRAKNTIKNGGEGAGAGYTHQMQYRRNTGSWTNIYDQSQSGIAAGGSNAQRVSASVSLGNIGAADGDTVCFRGRINNFTGTNTGGVKEVTSSGWRYSSERCVTVNAAGPTCSPATQTVFVNTSATLVATSGDGNFSWSASNGDPSMGSNNTFSVKYSTTGNKTVAVTSNGKTTNCTVVVQAKASCSPQNQTVVIGGTANFNSSGGDGSYNWIAVGGNPSSSNSGSSFSTTYSDYGQYEVKVTTRGDTATCNVNVTVPNCKGINSINALIPGFPSAVKVTLTNGTTAPAKSGSSTSPSQSHDEYKENGIVVKSVSDTSPDGFHTITIPYNDFSQSNNNSTATVNLDYREFVVECPYDTNRATVNYTYNYKKQNWRSSSSPTSYDCPSGGDFIGTKCYKGINSYCPNYESGGTCYQNRANKWKTLTGGCSTSGIGDFCGYQYSNPQDRVYYCQNGWTNSNNTQCTQSARPLYQWNKNGGESDGSQEKTQDGATMEPCDTRTYSAESVTTNATLNADHENPTSSTINGKITVDFGVSNETTWNGRTNMRRASSVALPYRFEYKRTTGSWTVAASGDAIITSSSRNKNPPDKDSGNLTANVNVQVPNNILPGEFVSWRLVTGGTSATNQRNGTIDNAAGVMSSSGGTDTDTRITPSVENWPYIKVFGNDVVSGGTFSGCSATAGNGVKTKYRSGAFGSSSQYGIFSIGSLVSGFVSSGLKGNTSTNPKALTFANTSGTETYGGNFNGSSDQRGCLPNYFSNSNNSRVTQLNSSGNNIARGNRIRNVLQNQNAQPDEKTIEYYKITGNVNLKKSGPSNIAIKDKSRKVIYVDGTIWIDDNIVSDDTWNKKEEIPFTMFIARNVVIDRSVTSVDAVFVAQGSSASTGNIWTCDENTAAQIFSSCNGRLQINGALIARSVHFMRSFGSLRDGTNNEGRAGTNTSPVGSGCGTYGSATPSSTGTNGGTTCASEVVSFSPDVYLILSEILTPGSNFKYDSYVNAAPNL